MTETQNDRIRVVVAMDFDDDIMNTLQEVSPKLQIERHYPNIPDSVWAEAEILYTMRHFPEPEQAPLLRWIQLHYAGMERALQKRIVKTEDITVTSASGIHATQMANYCLMMVLAFHYRLLEMMEAKARAEWAENRHETFAVPSLSGQVLGIAGYGSIGRELARIANQLGMTVIASKRDVKRPSEVEAYVEAGFGDPEGEIPERIYPGEAIKSMASASDYLVITLPSTDQTHHTINEEVLAAMKPSSVLINVARGEVVDEAALISALAAGVIRGAALDVFEQEPLPSSSPLWNLDNVIISPHVSGDSADYHQKAAELFAENLRRYIENRPLLNKLDRETGY